MNVRLYVNGGELSAVSLKGLPLWPNKELLKVPGDIRPTDGTPDQEFGVLHEGAGVVVRIGELVFQVGKDRMCVFSIDVALLEDSEVGFEATTWTHMLQ